MTETSNPAITADHGSERRFVRIPDLFSSIMASRPAVNPNYFKVKAEGDRWISRIMNWDEETYAKYIKADFCYLSSMWAPDADEDALRFMLDLNYWVFLFDDQFDEGHLKDDPVAAQDELDQTMAIMEDDVPLIAPEEKPIRYVFQTCWLRQTQRASPESRQRYKDSHRIYFGQLLVQVQQVARGEVLSRDVGTYLEVRRGTIGAYSTIVAAMDAERCQLPDHVFSHNSLQERTRISTDLTILVNDLLSYRKDIELGVEHNLITLLMERGLPIQQAVNKIGTMIRNCYKQ
ncbi:isoprenoid synthase domain-containing protein [Annulohypoxylon nitens]|nr:isoprenoid synthase domain-containing protein [Annulohypoxylon nitens]